MTLQNGNYTAQVTKKTDGYGDQVFCVKVLCMTGTHVEGDVLFLKNYDKESVALRAAKRELAKVA